MRENLRFFVGVLGAPGERIETVALDPYADQVVSNLSDRSLGARDVAVIAGPTLALLAAGAATLRRRTP